MDNPLKRPREDDTVHEEKRHRRDTADELTSNVCGDICVLDPRSIEDVAYISNPIVIEFENIDKLRNTFLSTVYAMVLEQQSKLHIVSDLVIICNAKNMVVGKYVIEYLHLKLLETLNEGDWNRVKILLKFFATLTPIIQDVVPVFRQVLQYAIDNKLDQLYYGVVMAIPYLFANEDAKDIANPLVELAASYTVDDQVLELYQKGITPEHKIYLLAGPAVVSLKGDGDWKDLKGKLFTQRRLATAPIIAEALANNPISKEMVKHPLPQVALPQDPNPSQQLPMFSHIYNHATSFETVPNITSYSGLFFRDVIADTINLLHFAAVEAGTNVYQLELAFPHDLAPELTTIEQLELIDKDNKLGENSTPLLTWKSEEVVVENIVNLLLLLPEPEHPTMYFFKVLLVICHENPANVAPVFGRAIRHLYSQLETMDFELRVRFANWMLIQLSNFDFSWKWDEWVDDSKLLDHLHPKINFITNLIGKEIRLANKKRIKELFIAQNEEGEVVNLEEFDKYLDTPTFTTPVDEHVTKFDVEVCGEAFAGPLSSFYQERKLALAEKPLITAQDEMLFPFNHQSMPLREITDRVYDFIVSNYPRTNAEFKELTEDVVEAATKEGVPNPQRFMVNLIAQTYCYVGSRSIFSAVALIARDVFKFKFMMGMELEEDFELPALGDAEISTRQQWLIDAIIRIWYHHPQMVFLLLEHIADFDIITSEMVLKNYFEQDLMVNNFACYESVERMGVNKVGDVVVKNAVVKINEGGNEWLIKDYVGLVKLYYRRCEDKEAIKAAFETLEDISIKERAEGW